MVKSADQEMIAVERYLQFSRGRGMLSHTEPQGKAPGLVRKQKEWGGSGVRGQEPL